MSQALPTLGLIGLGQLGLPVARNLLQAGYAVSGYRRSAATEFEAAGGKRLASPGAAASACDILLLCLPDEAAQRSALEGTDGVLAHLKPGQIVIELGTYSRAFKLEQAARLSERGARVLEAEVSGSPPMVSARKAALYIGGEAALLEECKPVLHAITEGQFHLGPYGAAVAMKLIANYLLTIHTLAAAEAMNMGARAGFDPRSGVTLWEKMSANNQNAPPEWMSTHPSGNSRIQEMQANMNKVLPLYQRAKMP